MPKMVRLFYYNIPDVAKPEEQPNKKQIFLDYLLLFM